MTDLEITLEVAKLDGITPHNAKHYGLKPGVLEDDWCAGLSTDSTIPFKPYLTSRDAIIPVIEKCITLETWEAFKEADVEAIKKEMQFDDKTPVWKTQLSIFSQPAKCLCIALLKAKGRYF